MMDRRIPWDEIGEVLGSRLVIQAADLTRELMDQQSDAWPLHPDFTSDRWRYEFCIFHMFWTWYIANSSGLSTYGATKPLLDHYYSACYRAMTAADLVSVATYPRWKEDIEQRFPAYKQAFEREDKTGLRIYSGTVGYVFLRFVEPEKEPPGLAIIMTEVGSIIFRELVAYIERLEERYG